MGELRERDGRPRPAVSTNSGPVAERMGGGDVRWFRVPAVASRLGPVLPVRIPIFAAAARAFTCAALL
jgi:hypothetical protein